MALLGLSGSEVLALSLGRITVQSSLGEPLRAEIEIPDITADEASSLKANVASPDAFVAAGLEYNPAMSTLRATLLRRPDGRAFIRLTSDRNINEPFVDMILEASWSSGRIVRDYTMLFDPPSLKPATPAPTLPQVAAPPVVPAPVKAVTAPPAASGETARPAANAAKKPATSAPAAVAVTAPPALAPKIDASNGQQLLVKSGDTASKIAGKIKSSDVSLDQMLVALMRTNPDAFSKGNINRLRAGAILDLPTADQAKSIAPAEATQVVIAQSKDFNEFRRSLATNAPTSAVESADRKSGGKVDAKVEDKKPGTTTPDKLTLSKGAVPSKADEAKVAQQRADKDAAARAAEIAKNISDLKKIAPTPSAEAAPANKQAAAAPSSPPPALPAPAAVAPPAVPTPTVTAPVVTPPVPAVVASESKPAAAASAPAKPTVKPVAPALPVEEPDLIDELLADPTIPAAGAGILAVLAGGLLYVRKRRSKKAMHVDSSFLESRLQPDSFFGASGGQKVDTANDGPSSASSMVYSASQLDAADDVDPVAEADVYLAYGRDLQAEEILKEAVKHNPLRLAIHTKLLEIYAKRRDAASFQASATQAFKICGAESPEWARICEMGLSIDPDNRLYQPGGATLSAFGSLEPSMQATQPFSGNSTVPMSAQGALSDGGSNIDLDLDLDFSADEPVASAISDVTGGTVSTVSTVPAEVTAKMEPVLTAMDNSLDFDVSAPGSLNEFPPAPDLSTMAIDAMQLDMPSSLDLPDFQPTGTMPAEPVSDLPPASDAVTDGMLEFDLGSLSLDLESSTSGASATAFDSSMGGFIEDPLETKLALAEEFVSIGDHDGARALIEEVVAQADGNLKAKAEVALAALG
jgi:pilus assembly protein FimV